MCGQQIEITWISVSKIIHQEFVMSNSNSAVWFFAGRDTEKIQIMSH